MLFYLSKIGGRFNYYCLFCIFLLFEAKIYDIKYYIKIIVL